MNIWKLHITADGDIPPGDYYFTDEQSAWDYLRSYHNDAKQFLTFNIWSINVIQYTNK